MLKCFGAGIALVAALVLLGAGPGSTTAQNNFGPDQFAFWSESHGIGTGRGGIELTTNGGRSWHVVVKTPFEPRWVAVTGRRLAWAGVRWHVVASADGGRTWHFRSRRYVYGASFANSKDGWALNTACPDCGNRLLATRDGGRTWHRAHHLCHELHLDPVAVSRVTPMHGWLLCVGEPGAGSQSKAVYETLDAGKTWAPEGVASYVSHKFPANGLSGYGYADGISFYRNGAGLLWTDRSDQFRTMNGGRQWKTIPAFKPEQDFGYEGSMFSETGGYLLVWRTGRRVRNYFELLRTTDAGRHWAHVRSWTP